ncbi:MAG: efflux RND transporter periplasmic adaptor subunit [Pseudomonadota bacterium]
MKVSLKSFVPVFVLLGAAVIVGLLFVLKPAPPEEEADAPSLTVKYSAAEFKRQWVSTYFQGEVRAKADIDLITQVTGNVISVSDAFTEGGEFAAGDTLLRIDDADYRVALRAAEASVASAQVDLELELGTAATNAKQWQELQGRPVAEANPLTLNKPQVDRARAMLEAAKAELAQAELNYQRTFISAPFDGRIMTKDAELGKFMSRGASIARVFSTQEMEIRIPMTDIQISELGLQLGYSSLNADRAIDATVSAVFGIERYEWLGVLKSVDASIDNETRLVYATVVVEQPFGQAAQGEVPLVPGLYVDVELEAAQELVGIQVPRTAIRNGSEVYVAARGELRREPISVIFTSEDYAVIDPDSTALTSGDLVITSPVPGAYNGMAVVTDIPDINPTNTADDKELLIAAPIEAEKPLKADKENLGEKG